MFEQAGSKAATLEGLGEPVGIAADVCGVGGDIRDRQKLPKLAQDLLLAGEQKAALKGTSGGPPCVYSGQNRWTRYRCSGSAMGLGLLAGIRLYATVFALGLAIRMGWFHLSSSFSSLDVLAQTPILALSGRGMRDRVPGGQNSVAR